MRGLGRRLACTLGMMLLAGSTAFAHPGHESGGGDFSLSHYLTEPEHLMVVVPLLLLVAFGASQVARSRRARG